MKIGIVGAGSIGLLFGFYLSEEHEVTYYLRNKKQIDKINIEGISLKGNPVNKKVEAKRITDLVSSDILIIALKQTHIPEFIEQNHFILKNHLNMFIQNGLEHINYINKYNLEAILGIVEHGAVKLSDQKVDHLGHGVIKISPYQSLTNESINKMNQLKNSKLNFILFDDWKTISYEKLVINGVINPLTAIFNVSNGELINNIHLKKLAKELCQEISIILNLEYERQWENVKRICNLTSKNTSSMRADILTNKPTEIEAIIGYLLKQTHVNYPYLQFVYQGVKAMEKRG